MRNFLRSRGGDASKRSPGESFDDHPDESKPGSEGGQRPLKSEDGWVFMPAVLLLSCLLLSTLYLLRVDNRQLGVAERKIRDLRRHVSHAMHACAMGAADMHLCGQPAYGIMPIYRYVPRAIVPE